MIILTKTRTEAGAGPGAGAGAGPGAGAGAGIFWSVSCLPTSRVDQRKTTSLCRVTRGLSGLRGENPKTLTPKPVWSQQKIPAPGPAPIN